MSGAAGGTQPRHLSEGGGVRSIHRMHRTKYEGKGNPMRSHRPYETDIEDGSPGFAIYAGEATVGTQQLPWAFELWEITDTEGNHQGWTDGEGGNWWDGSLADNGITLVTDENGNAVEVTP